MGNYESVLKNILQKSDNIKAECPIDALPNKMQIVAKHFTDVKGYPIDYFFTGLLTAVGTAIGNSHELRTVNGYTAKANLNAVICGRRGFNKSEGLTDAFRPIYKFQKSLFVDYTSKLQDYRSMSKDEKENAPVPFFGKPLLSDATVEAVAQQMSGYPKGCAIVFDELAGFIKSFDRYSSGSDETFYLSAWSGKPVTIDLKTSESLYVPSPFVSIIGTIQPEVLDTVFNGKEASGFVDRWLICYPDRIHKAYPSSRNVDPTIEGMYESILNILLNFKVDTEDQIQTLTYSPESWKVVYTWICTNTDHENDNNTTATEGGIRAKLDIYLHRFCLIMQLALFACGEATQKDIISEQAALSAVKIADYFYVMAERKRLKDKSELLTKDWKAIYDFLPESIEFTTYQFLQYTKPQAIPERTAKKWLSDNSDTSGNKILLKVKHGTFIKV